MTDLSFIVPTRQKAEALFQSSVPIASAGSFKSDAKLVMGYATASIFAVSDQSFQVVVLESCDPEGPFAVTQTFTSSANGSSQAVSQRFAPFGEYMKLIVSPIGPGMGEFDLLGQGIPT